MMAFFFLETGRSEGKSTRLAFGCALRPELVSTVVLIFRLF